MSALHVPSWPKPAIPGWFSRLFEHSTAHQRCSLAHLAALKPEQLPDFVQDSPIALKYLRLLGSLDWDHLPERPDQRFAPDIQTLPYAPFVAACLVKIDQHQPYRLPGGKPGPDMGFGFSTQTIQPVFLGL